MWFATNTYHKNLYTRLCGEDKVNAKVPESKRLVSLSHSTLVAGQPGSGERLIAFGISVTLNKWDREDRRPLLHSSVATSKEETNHLLQPSVICIRVHRYWGSANGSGKRKSH